MSKSMINFTKGIVTGVVVGTTVGIVMNSISKPVISKKKNAGRMIRNIKNIGNVISHATDMMMR